LISLHAAVRWGADQRQQLEHLCRYITRPAIANERLKRNRRTLEAVVLHYRLFRNAPRDPAESTYNYKISEWRKR